MNIPIIPLPSFLVEDAPSLIELHNALAWGGLGAFIFCGLLLLVLWVPGLDKEDDFAMFRVRLGYGLLAFAFVFLLGGTYIWVGLGIAFVVFLIVVLIKGFLSILPNSK